ncbi:hypothetical protein UFOVP425_11 [uncultured Caudovirales phage]|uniref:DUF6291 domain-containing protein n=1 Tax=uncultured Caudovirales phage TaxID=2100421 RepID=A0A6J5M9M8_9CAUD|nr:hypothetical protein UFOVP425_11 [uncultured Caudovirales phage]
MAKDKKSFILYADQKDLFNQLPDEIAGKLIKHIYSYVNDENPESEDLIVKVAFEPIKQQLKRDLRLFEEKREKRSEAGKEGANKRWQNIAKDSKRIKRIAKIADNVNDNDNVNDISSIDVRKNSFAQSLQPYLDTYGKEMLNEFYLYWTEPDQKNKKMKFEMQTTWSLDRRLNTWSKQSVKFGTAVSKAETPKFNPYG